MEREALALLLQQGVSVEKIAAQFGKHPSTVAYWMRKFGLEAPNREKHAAKGGIPRERLEELVDRGLSIAGIAAEVGFGKAAVRHWLRRYGLRTHGCETAGDRAQGRQTFVQECKKHGATEFIIEGRGYYRCKLCRSEQVARRRRAVKAALVAEAGGCCQLCGYNGCVAALEFHHLDPAQKRLGISANGLSLSLQAVRAEIEKCILLCSNCHAEVESGVRIIALK